MTLSFTRTSLIAVALLVATSPMAHAEDAIKGTRLDINAQSQIKASPDVATITAGVVTRATTAQEARAENAKKMQAVFTSLKAKGISDKDVQTSGLTINPDYVYVEHQPPKIAGYQATNTINIRIHNLDKAPDMVDALVANGINQLNGPFFTIDNPEDKMNQARREAIQKARKKAELYADATGLKIKRIVSINENANMGGPQPYPMMMKAAMADAAGREASTPIAPGQVDVDVTVNITYELE